MVLAICPPSEVEGSALPDADVVGGCAAFSKARAASSITSQRSSNGVKFYCLHERYTTHGRPLATSKATRRPTECSSSVSLLPRSR